MTASALAASSSAHALRVHNATHEEMLERRKYSIGSSDAPAVAGLSAYRTRYQAFAEKAGLVEPEDLSDNEAVAIGNIFEDGVADLYEWRTKKRLHRVRQTLYHPQHKFMHANLDRRVVGEPTIVEIKTVGFLAGGFISDEWGPDNTDLIPGAYMVQAQHELAVEGKAEVCELVALIAGVGLRIYRIPRNDEIINNLITIESDFWRCVETKTPPVPISMEELRQRFPNSVPRPIEASDEVIFAANTYRRLKSEERALKKAISEAQFEVASFMGECDTLVTSGVPMLTFKSQTAHLHDAARFTADHPELAAQYKYPSVSRVMRLKGE